ncbi:hypothetical protein [Succinimonas amylolytica]|nr:hypothetical protein [Succinimonas amylolytica]
MFRLFRRGEALKPAVLEMIRRISSPWWLCTIGAESEGGSNLN